MSAAKWEAITKDQLSRYYREKAKGNAQMIPARSKGVTSEQPSGVLPKRTFRKRYH